MTKEQVDATVKYLNARLPFQVTINDLTDFVYLDWDRLMLGLVGLTFDALDVHDESEDTGGGHNVCITFRDNINDQDWWVGIEFVTLVGVDLPEAERSLKLKPAKRSW